MSFLLPLDGEAFHRVSSESFVSFGVGPRPTPCVLAQGVFLYMDWAAKAHTYARDKYWVSTGDPIDF